jgi:long-chain acyl-CoA synthetase
MGRLRVLSFSQVLDLGRERPVEPTLPDHDALALVMYTSGSTGKPKVHIRQQP